MTALVVLLCSVVASIRMQGRPTTTVRPACDFTSSDSVRIVRFATDTIATLRARTQRVRSFEIDERGLEIRTDDIDSLSTRNGGLAAFDCTGRLTFLWLDGG
jgi:hypothetical protein